MNFENFFSSFIIRMFIMLVSCTLLLVGFKLITYFNFLSIKEFKVKLSAIINDFKNILYFLLSLFLVAGAVAYAIILKIDILSIGLIMLILALILRLSRG